MTEKSSVNVSFQDNKLVAGFDGDKDGVNSIQAKLNLQEVYEELLKKGEAKVDAVITYKMEGTILKILVDTDKDSEPSLEIEANFLEGFKEATQK